MEIFCYRCVSNMVDYLDFKVFKPKYFNAYGFPTYWNWIIVSILYNLLFRICFFFLNSRPDTNHGGANFDNEPKSHLV